MSYTDAEHELDKERILTALDKLKKLSEEYKDIIAIPEVVTLHDITEYRLDTPAGPKQFKVAYNRATAVDVLQCFAKNDYIEPEQFECTIVFALQDPFRTKRK
jgi:hypothetical protein